VREFLKHAIVVLLIALTVYPLFYMFVTSLKTNAQIYTQFWAIPPFIPAHWENYVRAWHAIKNYILNSIVVSVSTVIGVLFFSSLSAYVFARTQFRGKEVIFHAILALLMVPGVLTLIPAFILVSRLGLFNNLLGLILPYVAGGQVFAIFLLRSFFEAIPQDYFDAARIDGASEFQIYKHMVLPLSKPILGTVAIMNVLSTWNDYIWPMVIISSRKLRTITIGLMYFRGEYRVYEGQLMAGNVLASIPIVLLFLFTMRLFIKGVTAGGLKL